MPEQNQKELGIHTLSSWSYFEKLLDRMEPSCAIITEDKQMEKSDKNNSFTLLG